MLQLGRRLPPRVALATLRDTSAACWSLEDVEREAAAEAAAAAAAGAASSGGGAGGQANAAAAQP